MVLHIGLEPSKKEKKKNVTDNFFHFGCGNELVINLSKDHATSIGLELTGFEDRNPFNFLTVIRLPHTNITMQKLVLEESRRPQQDIVGHGFSYPHADLELSFS